MARGLDLNALWIALQPVVDLHSGRAVGHEALIRGPQDSPWAEPAGIFAEARRLGREHALEVACRRLAFAAGRSKLPPDQRLFVNIDVRCADLMLDPGKGGLDAHRIAVEVSEQQEIVGRPRTLAALQRWRSQGCAIVLDDYGMGYASLGTLLALQPDIVKIDRYIVAALSTDRRHRAALESVVSLSAELGFEVVAEGVESREQVALLREIGIHLGQGFFLGVPTPGVVWSSPALEGVAAAPTAVGRPRRTERERPLAAFHEALFENIDAPAYYVDLNRTILGWNRAAESATGFASAEVVGRRCMARILDHTSTAGVPLCWGACPLVHAMADGRPREETVLLRHRLGHRVKVSVRAIPVRDGEGRVAGAIEVFRGLEGSDEQPGDPAQNELRQLHAGA